MPRTFYTADTHFSHASMVTAKEDRPAFRPQFADIADMNATIIDRWNATVDPGDTVIHLGDVAMGTIAESLPLVAQLNGTKILVPGNHDRCWHGNVMSSDPARRSKQQTKADGWVGKYVAAGFYSVTPSVLREVTVDTADPTLVDLCHFPYYGDHDDIDRFPHLRPADEGRWLIHGHLHNSLGTVRERMIDVGVDAWDFRPVPASTLIDIINGGNR